MSPVEMNPHPEKDSPLKMPYEQHGSDHYSVAKSGDEMNYFLLPAQYIVGPI
jgi:hypothetical protein